LHYYSCVLTFSQFSNLLGTVYGQGSLVFTPDGNSLLSPVGNRVSVFNLTKCVSISKILVCRTDIRPRNTSYTLPFAHRKNIVCIALNPQGNLLLSVDEDGQAILTIFPRRISIYRFSLKSRVTALAFSPSGDYFIVGLGRKIQAWRTPSTPGTGTDGELEFAPFVLHREYGGHYEDVYNLQWSGDSRFFVSASKDLTARIWSLNPEEGFEPTVLSGHRENVRNAWFSANQESIYTVSKDGALFEWQYVQKPLGNDADGETAPGALEERWRIVKREYFMQSNAKLKCACFHPSTNLLTVCFSNGVFSIYELPSFANIHTLSIASSPISTVTINKTGEWLAFGSSKAGQLLVWEHASESHILKQSNHSDSMTALSYSPKSDRIITGSGDGNIKIWDVNSGFHIATFTEHSSAVTASQYSKRGNILFTSSLDGSVRAWDMLRYRNFRTFTAPTRLSFSSLAIDPSAEIVCASSLDSFDIHVWSVQTGQLLDQLSGHEGPISTLAFTPDGATLASGSWDHTIRLWSIFARTPTSEPLPLTSDILSIAISSDSTQLCASTLDGNLTFFSISTSTATSTLSSSRDVSGGRTLTSRRAAASDPSTKSFTTITYSADGTCLLAGGNSKYICLYAISTLTLIKKYTISINLSLDGTQEFLNSSAILSNGLPRDMLDADTSDPSDLEDRIDRSLPGVKRGTKDAAGRTLQRPTVRVTALQFAPTGRSFCAATTEGLLIYSLDNSYTDTFDPFDLDMDVTPQNIRTILAQQEPEYLKALIMSFRLADHSLIRKSYESIPYPSVPLLVKDLPRVYLKQLLRFIAQEMTGDGPSNPLTMVTDSESRHRPEGVASPHLEFNLRFLSSVLTLHGRYIKEHQDEYASELRALTRGVDGVGRATRKLAERNIYEIDFLCQSPNTTAGGSLTNGHENDEPENAGSETEWIGLD
jgi:periodic tryptophan protein 2